MSAQWTARLARFGAVNGVVDAVSGVVGAVNGAVDAEDGPVRVAEMKVSGQAGGQIQQFVPPRSMDNIDDGCGCCCYCCCRCGFLLLLVAVAVALAFWRVGVSRGL